MRHLSLKRLTALACALVLSASLALSAAAYESKCPDCGIAMVYTPVQPTCIDNGYMYMVCPQCGGWGTGVGAYDELENGGRPLGHDYGSSGICSRCRDDARPPQTRPGVDSAFLTGADGHTHDYKLMGNMFARKDHEGRKEWVCQTCKLKLMEDVPPLDENGIAQSGSTFRIPGSSGSGSTTTPGGSTANPGGSESGSTTTPGDSTANPGGSTACDHAKQPSSEWTYETTKATCTAEGRSYRTCKKCGYEETLSTLKMLDHTWEQKTEAASVGKEGRTYRVCTICGKEETLSTTEALKPEVSTGVPGQSDRGVPFAVKGSGYELVKMEGELIHNINTQTTQDNRILVVDSYDSEFKKTGTKQLDRELPEYGGVYFGETYNFLVFG